MPTGKTGRKDIVDSMGRLEIPTMTVHLMFSASVERPTDFQGAPKSAGLPETRKDKCHCKRGCHGNLAFRQSFELLNLPV